LKVVRNQDNRREKLRGERGKVKEIEDGGLKMEDVYIAKYETGKGKWQKNPSSGGSNCQQTKVNCELLTEVGSGDPTYNGGSQPALRGTPSRQLAQTR
jgi:hypothetical protein